MSGLGRYVGRRLVLLLFVVWCVLSIIFALFQLLPGDPTSIFVDSNLSVEMIERQKTLWGLNDPLWLQYFRYIKNMALFDFGDSFFQNEPVREILLEKAINTCLMIVPALIVSVVLGTIIGAIAGWKRGSGFEQTTVTTALILPALVLISREVTGPILLLRSSMLEIKGSDFVEILRAKGLRERRIITHATRNALLPLVTYIAVMTGLLFQGQVLLEIIFAWPGLGREMVTALNDLDYPVAQAALYLMALVILAMNFIADLLYGVIDPRVTYG